MFVGSLAHAEITAVVNTDRVSVRARASIFSEVVAQLRQGDRVIVLEVIRHNNPRPGEPVEWVKIEMPRTALVWVNGAHVDAARKVVTATKLNVRAGPG
ncbi:MAG: SH3 domain-containing protein, partial [Verrucomicrobiae bacterium]|nr:SH3 domain-containing protein [Verrucomicrobiae bacterium]